jgi:hypothetical protein
MDKFYKVRSGAIRKEVPQGSLKWYLMAGWRVIEDDKTNTKKKTTSHSNV